MRLRLTLLLLAVSVAAAACGGDTARGADLVVDRTTGYAVIVEQRADGTSIGFSEDRDATSGLEYDVSESVWRIDDGPWIEPPVTCLGKGQRIELGISQVENEDRPGLLKDRVVWLACLSPEEG